MDEALVKLLNEHVGKRANELRVLDVDGTVEVTTKEGPRQYKLKNLRDLYDTGVNAMTIVPDSPEYMPLFLGIEQTITRYWPLEPDLTDGRVTLALDRLAMSPDAPPAADDDLHANIQLGLRLCLSSNNYSRKDVQRALRTISKSVARHTRSGGCQGYLTFIKSFLG